MLRKKTKNQYGTFSVKKPESQLRLKFRKFSVAIMAMVFIFGSGIAAYKHFTKKTIKSSQAETPPVLSEIPPWWNQQYFNASICDNDDCKPEMDPDKDKLTNLQEYYYHTNPLSAYTIKDELNDGELVAAGFDPSKAGRVTFEEVVTDENVLGESLVFGNDVRQLVTESNDITKVNLPVVKDDQIKIVYTEDEVTYRAYFSTLQSTITRYFRQDDMSDIREILKSGSDSQVKDIKMKSEALSMELKTVSVPFRFVLFHKYNITMFQLLSEILPAPTDLASAESEAWYDKVQAFLLVQQRIDAEEDRLRQ